MTPLEAEATDKLFKAAKSGDIAAAQSAINAKAHLTAMNSEGHTPMTLAHDNEQTDMVEFLLKVQYEKREKKHLQDERSRGVTTVALVALWGAFLLYLGGRSSPNIPVPDNKPVPKNSAPDSRKEMESVQKQLHSVLKDPAVKDRLIDQIKNFSVIEELMADPEIAKHLQKIAHPVERNANDSPGQTSEQDHGNGDSKDLKTSRNWIDKAIQEKGAQSLDRN